MDIILKKSELTNANTVAITGSKSESNRALLLQALYPQIQIENASNSDDSVLMRKAINSDTTEKDIHHAGTAMRFLTAYFAAHANQEIVLTGSSRMKERPIKILVDALQALGASIEYLENDGFPPLKITGKTFTKNKVSIAANVSSQYISALLLIAPTLKNGLELTLVGEVTSVPYINMTLGLLNNLGVATAFKGNSIHVEPFQATTHQKIVVIESDWSSASYYYSLIALSAIGTSVTLSSYKQNSLQGDSVLAEIYRQFGVVTSYQNNSITLTKETHSKDAHIELDLRNAPDIAQTIAVTCFGLQYSCNLTGLHTLKIKETDRLVALQNELGKLGATVTITDDSLQLQKATTIHHNVTIETYKDHRMAMAFAPLALKTQLIIEKADVVTKSYPDFWEDMQKIGIKTQIQ